MFDTLSAARTLTDAGIDRKQADAIAQVTGQAAEHHRGAAFATRADLQMLRADLYRAMLIQTGALLAGVAALIRLFDFG